MKRVRFYIFLYITATMFLDVAYRTMDRLARGRSSDWSTILLEQATGFYGIAVLLPFILWSARHVPFRISLRSLVWHAAALLCFSVLHTSWNWGTRLILFHVFKGAHYDYGLMPLRYAMEFPSDLIAYGLWLGAYAVYRNWQRAKDLETQLVLVRLENLSRQLQPHFLFNALNSVSSVMYEDVARADQMLGRLSDFLRATLRLPESPLVPVSTELALVRQYLDVMQSRLEDRLRFEICCDPRAELTQLPALLLQPLVENAVEHGQDPGSGCLDIGIAVRRDGPIVHITIRDHGSGPASAAGGQGLQNAHQRLRTIYGNRAALRLDRHPQGGALVEISIPA
jgi:two-component system, LytTR family, sensor kinase